MKDGSIHLHVFQANHESMSLPPSIQELFIRYGPSKIVHLDHNSTEDIQEGQSLASFVIVKNRKNEYVLVRHTYDLPGINRNDWTIPGGKVEEGESMEEAAVREAYEETGLEVEIKGLYKIFHHTFHSNVATKDWFLPVFFGEALNKTGIPRKGEIQEVEVFKVLPDSFMGDLGKHYKDLQDSEPGNSS